jgi:hypothetical protein
MYPTPPMRYFGAHLNGDRCKPHLRLLGQALFGSALNQDYGPASGGIFTRFMIAGFATYRALQSIAAAVFECYPDLQFKLWRGGEQLSSKNSAGGRSAAFASRIRVLSALARKLAVSGCSEIRRMDEADAAVLALSTVAAQRWGATLVVENTSEGSFIVAVDDPHIRYLQKGWMRPILKGATVDPLYTVPQE